MTEDIQIESGFLSLTSRENWTLIIKIHQLTKELSIWAEEIGFEEFGTFLQPWAEIRSAYDHIIRAKVEDLGLWKEDKFKDKNGSRERDEEYIKTNMDKALGHREFRVTAKRPREPIFFGNVHINSVNQF